MMLRSIAMDSARRKFTSLKGARRKLNAVYSKPMSTSDMTAIWGASLASFSSTSGAPP